MTCRRRLISPKLVAFSGLDDAQLAHLRPGVSTIGLLTPVLPRQKLVTHADSHPYLGRRRCPCRSTPDQGWTWPVDRAACALFLCGQGERSRCGRACVGRQDNKPRLYNGNRANLIIHELSSAAHQPQNPVILRLDDARTVPPGLEFGAIDADFASRRQP